jgi:hypothetical protein
VLLVGTAFAWWVACHEIVRTLASGGVLERLTLAAVFGPTMLGMALSLVGLTRGIRAIDP